MKKGILKTLCGLMAALMLLVFAGTPVITQAAKLPYYIKINRQQNCVTVYALDSKGKYTKPVKAFACSVGVNNATPTGTFSIPAKYRWHTLMGGVYGQYCSRIHGGVLFHSVFYSSQDPSRLAYNSYNRLGQTASHGCVRLNVEDAKWIYDNCPVGTKVTIYDSKDPGPLRYLLFHRRRQRPAPHPDQPHADPLHGKAQAPAVYAGSRPRIPQGRGRRDPLPHVPSDRGSGCR